MNLNAPPPSRVQLPSLSLSLSLSLTHTHTHRQQKSLSKAWVCRTLRINYEIETIIECVTHIKHTHTPLATPFFPPPTPKKKKVKKCKGIY